MKNRGSGIKIGGTPDAGKAGGTGFIVGIGGIVSRVPARAPGRFVRARLNNFPRVHRKDTPDAHDKPCAMRVSDIGGTPDFFGVPPMSGFWGAATP